MTRKAKSTPGARERPKLLVSRQDAEEKIADRIEKGKELVSRPISSRDEFKRTREDYYNWTEYNTELLKGLFSNEGIADEYTGTAFAVVGGRSPTLIEEITELHDDINKYIRRLESIDGRLPLFPAADSVSTSVPATGSAMKLHQKAFVVHGHDDAARETVARFLERLGMEAVILHEQPSGGRTIIEKLEHNASDVNFAVVLLTPDDVGAVEGSSDNLSPRARQNVILELGYFLGKLGRNNVCALHKGDLELPSDFLGVVYVPMDDGGAWRLSLGKELREAGFIVDMNNV